MGTLLRQARGGIASILILIVLATPAWAARQPGPQWRRCRNALGGMKDPSRRETLELNFDTVDDLLRTTDEAKRILNNLLYSQRQPLYLGSDIARYIGPIRDSLYDLYQLHEELRYDSDERERRERFYLELTSGLETGEQAFGSVFQRSDVIDIYGKYFSAMQQLYSALMVGYGLIRSGYGPDDRLDVLELGSGMGDTTRVIRRMLPYAYITILDLHKPFLEYTKSLGIGIDRAVHHNLEQNARGRRTPLPFGDESQDVVISIAAATQYLHPRHFWRLMDDIHRVLRHGGIVIMDYGPHVAIGKGRLPLDELDEDFRAYGFLVERNIELTMRTPRGSVYMPILLKKIPF